MASTLRLSHLSPSGRALIRLIQTVNFGSILNLTIVNGEVSFNPVPEVLIDIRLDREVRARQELELDDFELPAEMCRLLSQIDAFKTGTVDTIIVHGGIPRRVTLRSLIQPAPDEKPSQKSSQVADKKQ